MQSKLRKLPILQQAKNKSTFIKDRNKIEDLLMQNARNRGSHRDYRHEQQFNQIRAANFLSRFETIDSPQVIFTVADQIKQISSSYLKQNQGSRVQFQLKKELGNRSELRRINQQRQQALNLGKWMDEKLKKFKAKTSITFMDILEYKQNILNYSLGRIIDSLTKKCKEQGQLLSLIWNNTFVMFEGVFNVLINANKQKEKEKICEAKELHGIFEINHNFLKQQNQVLSKQNKAIFEKMKSVIHWNKRLRKDRKQLFIRNRVLEYRLQTYTQSLQQTVQMLLQTATQPATIQTAKKIIQKLGRERNRKRNFNKRESDEQFSSNIKQMVYNWLKNNSYLNDDILTFLNDNGREKQNFFVFEEIKDLNQMNKVDIYDFFKLYDIGVQVSAETTNDYTQVDPKVYKNAEIMTRKINIIEHSCQTVGKMDFQNVDQVQQKRAPFSKSKQNTRIKDNFARAASKKKTTLKEMESQKSLKNLKDNKSADLQIQNYERMDGRRMQREKFKQRGSNIQYSHHVKIQKLTEEDEYNPSRYYEVNSVALQQGRKQGNRFERGNSLKKGKSYYQNSSASDYQQIQNGTKEIATNHLITNCSFKGRQKSMNDIPGQYSSSKNLQYLTKKRAERKSLTYATANSLRKSGVKLNLKKKFNEAYNQNRLFMKNHSEQFFDQIVRRRSFYSKKRVQFSSLQAAEETTQKVRDYLRGNRPIHHGYFKSFYQSANYVSSNIQHLSKKFTAPTNISKTKILLSAHNIFTSITTAIQKMARLPPQNKVFVNNSLSMITKYIQEIIPDYLKQIRREKQQLISDCQKALYPLNILLMEKMTFKYGLKDIAEKKIKNFIQKVLTFAPISQKIGLYSILLGLQDPEVGSDELLVYLKCLVYFDCKKALRETTYIDSSKVDLEVVRQNLRKILEYFFDHEYVNLVELKLEMYFQHNALSATVEGIAIIIVKELLKRKKDLKEKYLKMHEICSYGDNFYTNAFNLLKIYANYYHYAEAQAESQFKYSKRGKKENENYQSVQALQQIRRRQKGKKNQAKRNLITYDIAKISSIVKELLQRSDIIDEEYGKSITPERFVTAAVICGVPSFLQFEKVMNYLTTKFTQLKLINPVYESIDCSNWRGVEKLQKLWSKSSVGKSEEQVVNSWSIAKMYSDKIEEQVINSMGMLGTVGLYIESSLFNLGIGG